MPSRLRRKPAGVLQEEGFGEAATVERLLIDPEMQGKMQRPGALG